MLDESDFPGQGRCLSFFFRLRMPSSANGHCAACPCIAFVWASHNPPLLVLLCQLGMFLYFIRRSFLMATTHVPVAEPETTATRQFVAHPHRGLEEDLLRNKRQGSPDEPMPVETATSGCERQPTGELARGWLSRPLQRSNATANTCKTVDVMTRFDSKIVPAQGLRTRTRAANQRHLGCHPASRHMLMRHENKEIRTLRPQDVLPRTSYGINVTVDSHMSEKCCPPSPCPLSEATSRARGHAGPGHS